jgi:hypothetical protein
MRRLPVLAAAVALLVGRAAVGQQLADPDFKTKVAQPAYVDRHPSVLVDEAHHNFHTASGRYKPFAELISSDGYRVAPNRAKFTAESLRGCDVLVVANALGAESMGHPDAGKPAFTEDECRAVRGWVEAGGSLLLITDHEPMGPAAADLGKRLGVEMSLDSAVDPEHSAEASPSSLVFSRENGLLVDHPITRGRGPSERLGRIQTFTGQAVKGPEGSVAFLKLGSTASIGTRPAPAAGWAQGVAFPLGKGRTVVLGEAAQLSAQVAGPQRRPMGMNAPGIDNRQMALNIMHWLTRLID